MRLYNFLLFLLLFNCNPVSKSTEQNDLESGCSFASVTNKKVLLVFDLYSSPDQFVDDVLNYVDIKDVDDSYIVVRLFCDDRRSNKFGQSIGEVNLEIQKKTANNLNQPMFCLLDDKCVILSEPKYRTHKKEFYFWIDSLLF